MLILFDLKPKLILEFKGFGMCMCEMVIWWDLRLYDNLHISNQGMGRIEIFFIDYLLSWKQMIEIHDLKI